MLLAIVTRLGPEIFDELLLVLVEVALPDHDDGVGSTGCEVVAARREGGRGGGTLVAVERVQDVPLAQVPDLQGRVIAAREQVAAVRVEVNLVYLGAVCIVVLDEPLASDVPDLDRAVLAAASNAGAIRVEPYGVYAAVVVDELVDALAGGEVPQLYRMVVGAGRYQPLIRRKGAGPDPIIVRINREEELSIGNLMNLEGLVVRTR